VLGLVRNLEEIAASRDLRPRRLAATYASLRVRRAVRSRPERARLLGLEVAYADYGALVTLYEEVFIRRSYPFRPRRAHPFVVDCGANIGIATLFFKSVAPDAEVLAFEPAPASFALLAENVRHNRLAGVDCRRVALGREPGVATLHTSGPADGGGSLVFAGDGWAAETVEVQRLSDLLGGRRVDFLKLDVEGSEAAILDDLHDSGALTRVDELAFEFHPAPGHDLALLLRTLSDAGFRYRISVVGDRVWEPGQLLLVHAFRNHDPHRVPSAASQVAGTPRRR
jgi:FkbM family methyltransferase